MHFSKNAFTDLKKIFTLFLFFTVFNLIAQQGDGWTIESIHFEGLEKTKESYLRQFLKSKEGDTFQTTHLQNDVQQLWNVGTNQKVAARIDSLPNQTVKITFQLKEKKTLLPIVNLGGIKDNVWFQLGLIDFNWLGRGHQFLAFYQNTDNRHGGQIFYRIPYLNRKWGLAFNLLQWRSLEPLYFSEGAVNYDYDNRNVGVTLIRNFNFRQSLELGASFFQEKYKKSESQFIDNPPGPTGLTLPKVSSKIEYIHNFLNYNDIYLNGWSGRAIWQTVYNINDKTIFNSLILQARKFHRFGKNGNLAIRGRFGISTNNDTPFAPFVVDSRVNLRGSGNRIERGTGQLILNIEYRHTLLNWNTWAMQMIGFSDLGNWRSPGGSLDQFFKKEELKHFVGGGFRLIYKRIYDATLRVDYGVDIYDRSQKGFVIGIGQYF